MLRRFGILYKKFFFIIGVGVIVGTLFSNCLTQSYIIYWIKLVSLFMGYYNINDLDLTFFIILPDPIVSDSKMFQQFRLQKSLRTL